MAFRATSTARAPWYVLPADHKWYSRAAAGAVVLAKLQGLHDGFPEPDAEHRELLDWGRAQRGADGKTGGAAGRG